MHLEIFMLIIVNNQNKNRLLIWFKKRNSHFCEMKETLDFFIVKV